MVKHRYSSISNDLKGKVVALHTFQMLCPGCVSHGLPQAAKLAHFFQQDDLVVIGLHTVFEHHEAMQLESLKAFVHEYRLHFPIAVDAPSGGRYLSQWVSMDWRVHLDWFLSIS